MKIISGTSHPQLAQHLSQALSIPLTPLSIFRFSDQEICVETQENMESEDVVVLQSTSNPVNDHLMELLVIIDTLKHCNTKSITAIIPYFGYARQDHPQGPSPAKLVAHLLQTTGVDRLITFELHSERVRSFFDIPVDNLSPLSLFAKAIQGQFQNPLIIAPDTGGIPRAQALATRLQTDLAIIEKRRHGPGRVEVTTLKGEIAGRTCLIVDDIIDSGDTLCQAALTLQQHHAQEIHAFVAHGVLSPLAHERLQTAPLASLTITDTIDTHAKIDLYPCLRVLSVVPLLADVMHNKEI